MWRPTLTGRPFLFMRHAGRLLAGAAARTPCAPSGESIGNACFSPCAAVRGLTAPAFFTKEGKKIISLGSFSIKEGKETFSLGSFFAKEGKETFSEGSFFVKEGSETFSEGSFFTKEGKETFSEGSFFAKEG
jgi:hypothetical protein